MKCPKCNKEGAKESNYYPEIIVHKCDGKKLEEVGKVAKTKLLSEEEVQSILKALSENEHIDWLV